MTELSDAKLIEACLAGSVQAWETLVLRYKRLVFSIPRKWNLSPEDAMEVFQAVWIDCFRELHTLRDLDRLQPWLIRIAVRKSHRFNQDRRLRPTVSLEATSENPLRDETHRELIRRVELEQLMRTAVKQLSPRCRDVIQALFFEDPLPSYAEIALRLGLSGNSIGFTRDRCLDRLGVILQELGYKE